MEPLVSFELDNIADSHLDFWITPRAFLFRCFEQIEKAPLSANYINHMFFTFYLKYVKPQYETWRLQNMVAMKVYAPIETENFINVRFK